MRELRPTLLAFVHFFLIISSYYIIKPVRDALFVKTIGPDRMPLFYLVVAGVVLVVVALYNLLIRRFGSRLTVYLQGLVALNVLVFWWLMATVGLSLSASFYIWASVYNVLLIAVFWSLTNDTFDVAQGRKLYGVIGGGGIVGGIVGGLAASHLAMRFGTAHCLLAAGLLMVSAVFVTALRVRDLPTATPASAPQSAWRDLHLVITDRHVRLIAAVVFFVTLGKTVFNYHYYHLVDAAISDTDRATSFFGTVYAASSASSAILQFLVTTYVLRRFGAKVGLLFLPSVLLAAMVVMLLSPVLLVWAALNVAQQSTSYSINQSSKELLYTPCSEGVKYRTKAVIDMFVFRFGDAFAALLLLVLHTSFDLPRWSSLVVGLACVGYWLVMVLRADDPTRPDATRTA